MKTEQILGQIRAIGSEQTKKILLKHGAREPLSGVKVEDLKKILKGKKGNNELAAALFSSGVYDAMYLAGLMADGAKMPVDLIREWAETAYGGAISEYTVPWVASENREGDLLALSWIDSPDETIAVTGWSTFSSIVSVWPDSALDLSLLRSLLDRIVLEIGDSPERIRRAMTGFVVCTGCYVSGLQELALAVAARTDQVLMEKYGPGNRVPSAVEYIDKVVKLGRTGRKKKTAKC
ncbi:MAG: DNA alkylation repair protein [Bacteroidota bacterium]